MDGQPSDDELMARGAAGDEDAFRRLVERWQQPVYGFLRRMLDSHEDAQDLSQETFLRLCLSAPRYRPGGRFRAWLFRIAGNLARSRLRRRRLLRWLPLDTGEREPPSPSPGPEQTLAAREEHAAVHEAVARLPDRQRQALILRQYHGLRYREIAAAMHTTVPAVEALLHRALTALRRELSREQAEGAARGPEE